MARMTWALLAGLLLAISGNVGAAESPPAGTWKVTILEEGQQLTFWLVKLESKDGKWTGTVTATGENVPKSTLEDLRVAGDKINFTIKLGGQTFSFEGKVPKEAGTMILGSVARARNMVPAQLEPTKLTSLDQHELNKEILSKAGSDPKVFNAAVALIRQAADKKAKPEEVRGWADKGYRAAELYGPRWQREFALRLAEALTSQDGFAPVAVEYARRAERLLDPQEEADSQARVLGVLAAALRKADKIDEAKEIQARIDKLEAVADLEYLKKMPPFKPEAFTGRKDKSDRAVLVELFTGAQCPPCVAADLAFDGLAKAYKPSDVVLLQYHLHIPGPDPLSNQDTEARQSYYEKEIEGTPTVLFNGKPQAPGGGSVSDSKEKYDEFRGVVDPLLEKPAQAKLKTSATQKGSKIDIVAEVSDLESPGEHVRLRLALVEEQIRYIGGNNLRFHHHVVRALPGGAEGMALKEKTGKQAATVDLEELRKKLTKYLEDFAKENPFPSAQRPLDLKNLRVVAFVQNDKTKEVLQALQVEVKAAP